MRMAVMVPTLASNGPYPMYPESVMKKVRKAEYSSMHFAEAAANQIPFEFQIRLARNSLKLVRPQTKQRTDHQTWPVLGGRVVKVIIILAHNKGSPDLFSMFRTN